MSFASKFKREPGNYATKSALYHVYGSDYTFILKGVKFKTESRYEKGTTMPYLITYNPEAFEYYAPVARKNVQVPEGDVFVKTSADMIDFLEEMVDSPEYTEAITNGTAAFWIEEYNNPNQQNSLCYSIHFCELNENGERIED